MTVYIDVLIIINIYITYFTVRGCALILRESCGTGRMAAASVLGGICSLAAAADIGGAGSALIKMLFTLLIVLTAFGFHGIKAFMVRAVICTAESMLLCGIAYIISQTGSSFMFLANGYFYLNVSAVTLVVSTAVIYGVLSLASRFLSGSELCGKFTLTIENGGKSTELTALTDSGNLLRDFLTGRPVIVCDERAVRPVLPESMVSYLAGSTDDMTGIRLIPAGTAAGGALIAAFRPDRLTLVTDSGRKTLDALIGISPSPIGGDGFSAVMSPELVN